MTDCTRWDGRHRKSDGRPMSGRNTYVYVARWEEVHGPLNGLVLHHTCGNKWCINLEHLQPMTRAEHVALHNPKLGFRRTHCQQGHAFTEENTIWGKGRNGRLQRACRECKNAWRRRRRAERGA